MHPVASQLGSSITVIFALSDCSTSEDSELLRLCLSFTAFWVRGSVFPILCVSHRYIPVPDWSTALP
jgi:hypothetical protein